MANFIARVVLHGSEKEEDYEKLHEDMHLAGYVRHIVGNSGRVWEMPPAMYFRKAKSTPADERTRVTAAVQRRWTGKFAVFVMFAPASAWIGLDELFEADED